MLGELQMFGDPGTLISLKAGHSLKNEYDQHSTAQHGASSCLRLYRVSADAAERYLSSTTGAGKKPPRWPRPGQLSRKTVRDYVDV